MLVGVIDFQKRRHQSGKLAFLFRPLRPQENPIYVPIKRARTGYWWAQVNIVNDRYMLAGYLGEGEDDPIKKEIGCWLQDLKDTGVYPRKCPVDSLAPDPYEGIRSHVDNAFTIDDKDSKDPDDALTVEMVSYNPCTVRLGIHITDVACRMNVGSLLWGYVFNNVSTLYTEFQNYPMFSESLTERLAMIQDQARPCWTLWVTWHSGAIHNMEFERTIVTSRNQSTYDSFDNDDAWSKIRSILRSVTGEMDSRTIIQRLMIWYNEQVSMSLRGSCLPSLYRTQNEAGMACYSHEPTIHQGIGSLYCHATSPVRRWPDIYQQASMHRTVQPLSPLALDRINETSQRISTFHRATELISLGYRHLETPLITQARLVGGTDESQVTFQFVSTKGNKIQHRFRLSDPMLEFVNQHGVETGSFQAAIWGTVTRGRVRIRICTAVT